MAIAVKIQRGGDVGPGRSVDRAACRGQGPILDGALVREGINVPTERCHVGVALAQSSRDAVVDDKVAMLRQERGREEHQVLCEGLVDHDFVKKVDDAGHSDGQGVCDGRGGTVRKPREGLQAQAASGP